MIEFQSIAIKIADKTANKKVLTKKHKNKLSDCIGMIFLHLDRNYTHNLTVQTRKIVQNTRKAQFVENQQVISFQ